MTSCSDPAANQDNENDLFGKVVDSTTEQGLRGVELRLLESDELVVSDQDGKYAFETVQNGDYTLLVHSKAHIPSFTAIVKQNTNSIEKEISLSANASGEGDLIQFTMGQEQTIDGLGIRFSEVTSDSRCQIGVQCVWEGSGRTALDISAFGQSIRIFIDTNDLSDFTSTVEAFGTTISLDSLLPHPEINTTIDPNDYVLTLKINEK